jgi:cellulose synthase/poly-beta-1,6-N-acetylglucosamine synthase-like glycosyltransferase
MFHAKVSREGKRISPRRSWWPLRRSKPIVETKSPQKAEAKIENSIALIIAAHNEEIFIESTIKSAIDAGQPAEDIYVVDDGSRDETRRLAMKHLSFFNVTTIANSGKSNAVSYVVESKDLTKKYDWIHITDGDGVFGKDYFRILRDKLRPDSAIASAYMKSLPGTRTSTYRVYEYAWAMELIRPFQSAFNLITIVPGPTACFRADVFEKLHWGKGTKTEDYDVTMQVRRRALGKIQFIKEAYVLTQDPASFNDFMKQIHRWYIGLFQVAKIHRIGFRGRREDFYFLYQFIEAILIFGLFFVVGPLMAFLHGNPGYLATLFVYHVSMMFIGLASMAWVAKQRKLLYFFPRYYVMRWMNLAMFLYAFIEVELLNRHQPGDGSWTTAGRRYATTVNVT